MLEEVSSLEVVAMVCTLHAGWDEGVTGGGEGAQVPHKSLDNKWYAETGASLAILEKGYNMKSLMKR